MKQIKTRLQLSEYGRNVQEMVNYLKTIEDRELRNEQAKIVVAIMGNIYPHKRDSEGFQNMLWDHLFMIADFDLDIESPYPMPTEDDLVPKPEQLEYSQRYFHNKQYGRFAQEMIFELANSPINDDEKDKTMLSIAKFMRQQAYNFNNEYPSDDAIAADINEICGDGYYFDAALLGSSKIIMQPSTPRVPRANNRRQAQSQQRRNKRKG